MKITGKIISSILIILVIGFSGGINITKHLCNGKVVDKAVNAVVNKCKKAKIAYDYDDNQSVHEQPCCQTELDLFKSFSFEKSSVGITFHPTILATPFVAFSTTWIKKDQLELVRNRTPPVVSTPIYIKIERFLI